MNRWEKEKKKIYFVGIKFHKNLKSLGIQSEEEEEFIKLNPKGFIRVKTYSKSGYDCYKYNFEKKQIKIDQECELQKHKEIQIKELNQRTKNYIEQTLKELD